MKLLARVLAVLLGAAVLAVAVGFAWLYLYTGDIPEIRNIGQFAPSAPGKAVCGCGSESATVIPLGEIGGSVVSASRAIERDDRFLSVQIARSLICGRQRNLLRHLLEYKAAAQLRARLSPEQLRAAYLNRAYFGDGMVGISDAAQHYFAKAPRELDLGEAAALVGLLRAPSMFSPRTHADRARQRRDAVLQAMVERGFITAAAAQQASTTELRIVHH